MLRLLHVLIGCRGDEARHGGDLDVDEDRSGDPLLGRSGRGSDMPDTSDMSDMASRMVGRGEGIEKPIAFDCRSEGAGSATLRALAPLPRPTGGEAGQARDSPAHRFQKERRPALRAPPDPSRRYPDVLPSWTRPTGRPVQVQWEYDGEHGDLPTAPRARHPPHPFLPPGWPRPPARAYSSVPWEFLEPQNLIHTYRLLIEVSTTICIYSGPAQIRRREIYLVR